MFRRTPVENLDDCPYLRLGEVLLCVRKFLPRSGNLAHFDHKDYVLTLKVILLRGLKLVSPVDPLIYASVVVGHVTAHCQVMSRHNVIKLMLFCPFPNMGNHASCGKTTLERPKTITWGWRVSSHAFRNRTVVFLYPAPHICLPLCSTKRICF